MKIPDAKAAVDEERKKSSTRFPAWNLNQVQRESKKVHFATLMDICHFSKIRSWNQKLQKYKGRIALSGDIVEDDSGAYAVFAEQGSSASQMTAAKNTDVIARWPGGDWQAADAVSPDTQIKLENAPRLLKIPKSECFDVWMRLPQHKWPKSLWKSKDLVIHLERNLYGHPLAGLLWEGQFENASLELGWGENTELGMHVRSSETRAISVSICGWYQDGRHKSEFGSRVDELTKNVDIDENHIIPVPCVLGMYSSWMQTEWNSHWTIYENVWITCTAGAPEKLPGWQRPHAQAVAWSHDMVKHAQKCNERYCELANQFKQDELEFVGELSKRCSQKFDTNWTTWHFDFMVSHQTCKSSHKVDSSMWQTTSKANFQGSSHESLSSNWHVGYTAQHCRLGLFQGSNFAGDLEGSKSTQEVSCVFLETKHLSQWVGCTRNKLLSRTVPQSLKLFSGAWTTYGWIFCSRFLGHCDWGFPYNFKGDNQPNQTIFRKLTAVQSKHIGNKETGAVFDSKTKNSIDIRKQKVDQIFDVDNVLTNTHSSQGENQLYKRRSPTMRHVFRTHRVALDWLFDRINFGTQDPKLNMLTPKNQLAEILTNGSFLKDEWGHFFLFTQNFWVCRHIRVAISRNFLSLSLSVYRAYCVETRTEHNLERWLTDGISKTH